MAAVNRLLTVEEVERIETLLRNGEGPRAIRDYLRREEADFFGFSPIQSLDREAIRQVYPDVRARYQRTAPVAPLWDVNSRLDAAIRASISNCL